LGGGVAAELTQNTQVGADLYLHLIAMRPPPSPSSIEEEGREITSALNVDRP